MNSDKEFLYKCEMVRVIDGDTFELKLDCGFGLSFTQKFRLFDIDICESNTDTGKAATAFIRDEWLLGAGQLTCESIKIRTHANAQGKYGRYLARIYDQFGEELNEVLREMGFVKRA